MIVLSKEPDAQNLLQEETAREVTEDLWPSRAEARTFLKKLQTIIFLSSEAEIMYFVSDVAASFQISEEWPLKQASSHLDRMFHTRTVLSLEHVIAYLE